MVHCAGNCRNTHTNVDHTHSLTHLYQHSYNHEAPAQLLHNLNQSLILKVPDGGQE